MLPELVDPLFGKRLCVEDIRDPISILEAKKLHNKQIALNRQAKNK